MKLRTITLAALSMVLMTFSVIGLLSSKFDPIDGRFWPLLNLNENLAWPLFLSVIMSVFGAMASRVWLRKRSVPVFVGRAALIWSVAYTILYVVAWGKLMYNMVFHVW